MSYSQQSQSGRGYMKTMAARSRTNLGPVEPPDGGWGWAVVLAGFIVFACTWGILRSLGVFFLPWKEQFPDATAWEIALVQSILSGMTSLAAPVASALGRRFGFRPTIMAGGVIAAAGFSLSWFATRLLHLYITIGIIAGALRDTTGSYDVTFLFGGACATLGGLVPFLLHMRMFASRRGRLAVETPSSDDVPEKRIRKTYDYVVIRETSI